MEGFNLQFLYAISIIGLGFVLKQINVLKERDGEGLARVVFNITLPALIIVTFNEIIIDWTLILLIVIGVVYGIFSAVIGILVFRNQPREIKGMLVMMVPGLNIGLFAYPLVEGIWGLEGIKYFGMLDVGNAFIIFGLCYFIGSFYSAESVKLDLKNISSKMMRSIPFMTYVIVCSLNIVSLHLPSFIIDASGIIASANMPLVLLLLGIYLNFNFDRDNKALIIKFISLRYGIGLITGILLYLTLPFEDMFKYTLLIGLILPISLSALPYSVEFNYNRKFVGTVSSLSILISFVLIWLMGNIIL